MLMIHQAVAEAIHQERQTAMARAESRHRVRLRADRRAASDTGRGRFVIRWRPAPLRLVARARPEA
jgi:hypothetical protein